MFKSVDINNDELKQKLSTLLLKFNMGLQVIRKHQYDNNV